MVSVTLSIPEDVKKRMEHFSELNWSGFIRKAILEKTKELSWKEEMMNKLKKETEIDDWAVKLQHKAREERFKELRKKGLV